MSINSVPEDLDVLIVGAGFSGLYQLQIYRKLGYKCRVFDSAADIGGTWYWNRYPGARVDSPVPIYSFSAEELWKDWTWTEKYPGWKEIRAYFQHVEEKLELKKDITLNTRVIGAEWDDEKHQWTVTTTTGMAVKTRFLVLATGSLSVPYTPKFKGLETYEGVCHHTGRWPEEGVDTKGKKVAVIGTGATGVGVIQELGPEVGHLTVLQRTPDLCLPMGQEKLDVKMQAVDKALYPTIFRFRMQSYAGFDFNAYPKAYASSSPEERILRLEEQWKQTAFRSVAAFTDVGTNQEANDAVYAFWRSKVCARLRDTKLQDKLAPVVPPHPIGAKRQALEQTFYEVFNQDNVDLIDLNENPITEFTPKGIVTKDGQEHEFDVIVLATGWDSVTGSMTNIDLRGVSGESIAEKWKDGVYTNLGMTASGFPNMFFTLGPQAPTGLSNGPSCSELQGDWISGCIQHMRQDNITKIDATPEAENKWRGIITGIYDTLLMKKTRGWWNGANIPGKAVDILHFPGGIPMYLKLCSEVTENGYEGFVLSTKGGGSLEFQSSEF